VTLTAEFRFGAASLLAAAVLCGCAREPMHGGRPVADWLSDTAASDNAVRLRAHQAFRQWGDAGVANLLKVIRAANGKVDDEATPEGLQAQRALNVLMQLSPDNRAATDALVTLVNEYHTAGEAALYLAGTGPGALPLLTNALANGERITRVAATAAVGTFTNDTGSAVPALLRALHDEHYTVRVMAASSLSGFEPSPVVVAALASGLTDRSFTVRTTCANTLGTFGPAAQSALPALTNALPDRPDSIHVQAAEALKKIAPGIRRP